MTKREQWTMTIVGGVIAAVVGAAVVGQLSNERAGAITVALVVAVGAWRFWLRIPEWGSRGASVSSVAMRATGHWLATAALATLAGWLVSTGLAALPN